MHQSPWLLRSRKDSNTQQFHTRLWIVAGAVTVSFLILLARFFFLQVLEHDYYSTRAENNRISLVPIAPNRGNIVDRNGVVLARNYSAFTLEITPNKVKDLDKTITELSSLVPIDEKDKRRFQRLMNDSSIYESIPIRTKLTEEEVARFTAQRFRFPGVEVQARLFRQYPQGNIGAHAIGYINRINKSDLEKIEEENQSANYRGTDHIGKTGLEQNYEFALHGITGYEKVETDASGRPVRTLSRIPPIPGSNLTLTLDIKLQEIAEKAFGDRRGALVAIDPTSGGVLALVSAPTFDPNLFVDGIRTEDWNLLNNSPDRPLINRAIYSTYPPGSTFKPFMAMAALELGKRTPTQSIVDPGYFTLGNHTFRDDKAGGHGVVDMYKSIIESCDTYYYILANDLGIDNIAHFMAPIGFGSKTGIDIEGESTGVLPSKEWKKQRFKNPAQQKWFSGETISIGIGQGYNAYTIIQIAQAVATLANNGTLYRPHLVQYISDGKNKEHTLIEPTPLRQLKWKQANVDAVKEAMVLVNQKGTGAKAFANTPYVSAGKTGTAQTFSLRGQNYRSLRLKEHMRDHALFIAFAPADAPKIALAVIVENGGFGAQSAAPIARMVMDYYLVGKTPEGSAPEDDTVGQD